MLQTFGGKAKKLQEGEQPLSGAKQEKLRHKQEETRIRQEIDELEKVRPTRESFEPEHLQIIN